MKNRMRWRAAARVMGWCLLLGGGVVAGAIAWSSWPREASIDGIRAGSRWLELTRAWERHLSERAHLALRPAFGPGVVATVRVELEPTLATRTGVDLPDRDLPPNLVEFRPQVPAEPASGTAALPAAPDQAPAATTFRSRLRTRTGQGVTEKRQTDVALYGKRSSRQFAPRIRRLSAALVVDAALVDAETKAETCSAILEVTKNAIGFDPERGDQISEPAIMRFAQQPSALPAVWWWSGAGALFVVLGLIGVVTWRRLAVARRSAVPAVAAAADAPSAEPEDQAQRMRSTLERAIDEDPGAVSRMLGDWAMESRS